MANVVGTAVNSERRTRGGVPPVIDVVLEKPGGTSDYERLKNLPKLKVGGGEAVTIIGTVELPEIPDMTAMSNKDINDQFKEVFGL